MQPSKGIGLDGPWRSHPTSPIMWLCENILESLNITRYNFTPKAGRKRHSWPAAFSCSLVFLRKKKELGKLPLKKIKNFCCRVTLHQHAHLRLVELVFLRIRSLSKTFHYARETILLLWLEAVWVTPHSLIEEGQSCVVRRPELGSQHRSLAWMSEWIFPLSHGSASAR